MYKFLSFITFFVLLSACQEENLQSSSRLEVVVLKDVLTKADDNPDFASGSQIGLYITNGILGDYYSYFETCSNVAGIYNGNTWELTPVVYLDQRKATIIAYSPYNVTCFDGTAIPVAVTDQVDYLYGITTKAANNENPTVSLTMKHALSLLTFTFSKHDYNKPGKVSSIKIYNSTGSEKFATSGYMNAQTGQIEVEKNESAIVELSGNPLTTITGTDKTKELSILVFPVSDLQGVEISFTIDGYEYIYSPGSGSVWNKGMKHSYNIGVTSNTITVNPIIENWESGNEIEIL